MPGAPSSPAFEVPQPVEPEQPPPGEPGPKETR